MADELPVVTVRGESHLEVNPEIARVSVAVSARDRDRRRTLELVAARQRAVREVLDGFADALEDIDTSHIHVAPRYPKQAHHGEAVLGYTADVFYTLTLADLNRVGDLLARLAEVDTAQVHGPSWQLRPSSPAYRRAREAAVADALARAGDYATALGGRLVGLLEFADTGLLERPRHGQSKWVTLAAAPGAESGSPALDLQSGRQLVQATVEARFTMTVPTLLRANEPQ